MTTLREEKGEHLFLSFQWPTPRLAPGYQLIWGSVSMDVHCKHVVSHNNAFLKHPTTVLPCFVSWDEPLGYAKPKLVLNQVLHVITLLFLWVENKGRRRKKHPIAGCLGYSKFLKNKSVRARKSVCSRSLLALIFLASFGLLLTFVLCKESEEISLSY